MYMYVQIYLIIIVKIIEVHEFASSIYKTCFQKISHLQKGVGKPYVF